MGFEQQLESIVEKAELHQWIDELPEGSSAIIMAELPDGENAWHYFGDMTLGKALWLTRLFEHHVILT